MDSELANSSRLSLCSSQILLAGRSTEFVPHLGSRVRVLPNHRLSANMYLLSTCVWVDNVGTLSHLLTFPLQHSGYLGRSSNHFASQVSSSRTNASCVEITSMMKVNNLVYRECDERQ